MMSFDTPTELVFLDKLPLVGGSAHPSAISKSLPDPANSLVIFDKHLLKVSREFRAWVSKFPYRYPVASGEKLKDLNMFPGHFRKILEIAKPLSPRTMTIVAVGGGSIGDFAGFVASVFKRGVGLIHVPSTWLSAVDSAHGGKTALNCGDIKNMIGTFYPARSVILVQSLLLHQPDERVSDAMGELGKIALVDGGVWVRRLERTRLSGADLLWQFLKPAIQAKLKIVKEDPFETKGLRQVLNLGHTVGHVIEAAYHYSHGYSVSQGLFFALEYSRARGHMSDDDFQRARGLLIDKLDLAPELPKKKLSARRFTEILLQDKKKSGKSEVTYVFSRGVGHAERVSVPIDEVVREARRQGWVESR